MSTSSTRSSPPPSDRRVLTPCHSKLFSQLTILSLRDTVWIPIATRSTFAFCSDSARVTKSDSRYTKHFWHFWQSLESSCNSVRRVNTREDWTSVTRYRSSTYRRHSDPMAPSALGGHPSALGETLRSRVLELLGVETIRGRHYRDCRTLRGLCTRTGHRQGRPHGRRKEFDHRLRTPCRTFLQTSKVG